MELLTEIGLDANKFLIVMVVSSAILFGFFYRYLVSILDCLTLFVVCLIADSILMLGLPLDFDVKIEFVLYTICLMVGFAVFARLPKVKSTMTLSQKSLTDLFILLIPLFFLIVVGNLILGATAGFPLLSANPSVAKIENLTGGLGAVKRINEIPVVFFSAGCMLLAVNGYKRKSALIMLLIALAFMGLSGSKGALLPCAYCLVLLVAQGGFKLNSAIVRKIRLYVLLSLSAAILIAFVVVIKDQGGIADGFFFLGKRVLYYGDVVLYYFPARRSIPGIPDPGLLSYFKYLFAPTLGLLRIITYPEALGTVIMGTADSGFGPNAQYFVRADVFFGPAFGLIYCFVIGLGMGWLRRLFFYYRGSSAIGMVFRLTLVILSPALAVESQLFFTDLIDLAFLLVPIYIAMRLIRIATDPHLTHTEQVTLLPGSPSGAH